MADTFTQGDRVLITGEDYCCESHNPGDIDDYKTLPAVVRRRASEEDDSLDGEAYYVHVYGESGDELLTVSHMKAAV